MTAPSPNIRHHIHELLVGFADRPGKLYYDALGQEYGAAAVRQLRTVIANLTYLDFVIDKLIRRPIEKLDAKILAALRLGAAELLLLDVKPHAAIFETVELISPKQSHLRSFINGVLRSLQRLQIAKQLPEPPAFEDNPIEHLSVLYSHPQWLVKMFVERFGNNVAASICQANNQAPPIVLRVNTLQTDRATLMQQITPHCTKVAACVYSPDGIVVEGLPGIEHPAITPLWNQGHFYFQNEAAQLASLALDPQPGWNCVDLCSAPGGKASHLAQLMQNHDKVIAIESSAKKITRIHENLKRLKLHCVETVVGEANSTPAKKYLANANAVLLDPPCSALGTLRKSPEVRWLQSPTNIKKLAAQQWEILTHTIDSMRSGAIGVYSVCTFTVEETIDLLDRARHQRMDFEAMKISFPHPDKNVLKSILRDDSILTLPGQGPLDGYFIMRFRKR